MTAEKERRIRELMLASPRAPVTFFDYASFAEADATADSLWWVRPLSDQAEQRYRYRQGPWTATELRHFFTDRRGNAGERFAIQPYLEPETAGVSIQVADGLLSEGIDGPAAPLLRDGSAGDMLASHGGRVSWRKHRGALTDPSKLDKAHASIPPGAGLLWEWIVDAAGEVFHVDRKELTVPLIEEIPRTGPPSVWRLGVANGSSISRDVPATSVQWLSALGEPAGIRVARGSPLAHFCHEAVKMGHVVELDA